MRHKKPHKRPYWILIVGMIIILILLFTSCNIQKRAQRKRNWIEDHSKITLLKYCDLIKKRDTVIKPGKIIKVNTDTITVDCDSIILHDTTNTRHLVRVIFRDTVWATDTVLIDRLDTSGTGVANYKYRKVRTELEKRDTAKSVYMWLTFIFGGLLVLIIIGIVSSLPRRLM